MQNPVHLTRIWHPWFKHGLGFRLRLGLMFCQSSGEKACAIVASKRVRMLAAVLESVCCEIEAAGSLDTALRIGLIGGEGSVIRDLRRLVPVSRGGRLQHPDADQDWRQFVSETAARRGVDMGELRERVKQLESYCS